MQYEGIIFDLDGVICSTDQYHFEAWKALADELGIPFDARDNDRLRGVSRMESLEIVLEKSKTQYSQSEKEYMAEEKNRIYRRLLCRMGPQDLSGEVRTTLDALRARGLKLAIGSSSKNAPFILERIGLGTYFDAVSDGNGITHSKPDPEVFLKAAQFLDLAPAACLVVEDAVAGAQAGHAGGFAVACVGDAAQAGAGDYNLTGFAQLLDVVQTL